MANIFIVTHSTSGGSYVENYNSFHHTEEEARVSFNESMDSVGEDPCLIELIRLDTETLDAVSIESWEGTSDDLEDDGDGEEE